MKSLLDFVFNISLIRCAKKHSFKVRLAKHALVLRLHKGKNLGLSVVLNFFSYGLATERALLVLIESFDVNLF